MARVCVWLAGVCLLSMRVEAHHGLDRSSDYAHPEQHHHHVVSTSDTTSGMKHSYVHVYMNDVSHLLFNCLQNKPLFFKQTGDPDYLSN